MLINSGTRCPQAGQMPKLRAGLLRYFKYKKTGRKLLDPETKT